MTDPNDPAVSDITVADIPRAILPKRRPRPCPSRDDIVAIDQARRAAGIVYSPAYAAWLDRMAARLR